MKLQVTLMTIPAQTNLPFPFPTKPALTLAAGSLLIHPQIIVVYCVVLKLLKIPYAMCLTCLAYNLVFLAHQ